MFVVDSLEFSRLVGLIVSMFLDREETYFNL